MKEANGRDVADWLAERFRERRTWPEAELREAARTAGHDADLVIAAIDALSVRRPGGDVSMRGSVADGKPMLPASLDDLHDDDEDAGDDDDEMACLYAELHFLRAQVEMVRSHCMNPHMDDRGAMARVRDCVAEDYHDG